MLKVSGLTTEHCIRQPLAFAVEAGSMVAILGRNGAGKTTLIRAISGELNAASGTIRIEETPIAELNSRQRAQRMSVVGQGEIKPNGFTVREFVMMGRYAHQEWLAPPSERDLTAVEKAMERVQIAHIADRFIETLSGGEYQRARIARALTQNTKLVLLDEPMAHLDIAAKHQIANLLRELNGEDAITIIAAVHDLNIAALYFNQVAIMVDGQLTTVGSVDAVMTSSNLSRAFEVALDQIEHPASPRPQFLGYWQ